MEKLIVSIGILFFLVLNATPAFAHSGCCSHHGGVSGCGCADGTALSSTCLPYYPECSSGGGNQQDTTQSQEVIPSVQITTQQEVKAAEITSTPIITLSPSPIASFTPKPTPKITNSPVATIVYKPQSNFFSQLFSFLFGWLMPHQSQSTTRHKSNHSSTTDIAGITSGDTHCKAIHVEANDPQAYLPDVNCTPGTLNDAVTQANIYSTICVSGYTKTIRPPASYTDNLKIEQIAAYGYSDTNTRDYEEDHFISLELGGNPTDPRNLWPEPHPSTNEKDKAENYLHKQVCSGALTLAQAQKEISTNWYVVYKQIQ